jgi:prophage antirepressor-like protein
LGGDPQSLRTPWWQPAYLFIFNIFEDFTYNGVRLTIVKILDDIWFRANDITVILGYKKTRNAIIQHVGADYKTELVELDLNINLELL